jgi:beta-lactam-binding protein with PASTA domain
MRGLLIRSLLVGSLPLSAHSEVLPPEPGDQGIQLSQVRVTPSIEQPIPPETLRQIRPETLRPIPLAPITVPVPNLIGLTPEEAAQALGRRGLRLGGVGRRESDRASAGRVVAQQPGPDQPVVRGTAVQVVVGTGAAAPITVPVPNLIGLTPEEAAQALGRRGLRLGGVGRRESDRASAGRVVAQQPGPDRPVVRGTAVQVVVGTGPAAPNDVEGRERVPVPTLMGLTPEEAEQRLEEVGLGLQAMGEEESEAVTAGRVLRQEPGATSRVERGVEVRVWLARRPVPPPPPPPPRGNGDGRNFIPALLGALATLAALGLGTAALARWRGRRAGGAVVRLSSVSDPGSQEVSARWPKPLPSFTLRLHAQKDTGSQEVLEANQIPLEDSHDG